MKDRILSLVSRGYAVINRAPRLLVITFHRVGGDSMIGAELVRSYLTFLKAHYQVVAPSQLVAAGFRRPLAVVTVDDCHRDVYEHIYPVASALRVPITLCVPTDFFFRHQWLWFDKLFWLIDAAPRAAVVQVGGMAVQVGEPESMRRLKIFLKSRVPAERDAVLGELADRLDCSIPQKPTGKYRPVSQAEMREMLNSGLVELCAHTVTHPILTLASDAELRQEVGQSKEELENFAERPVASFCYPNGHVGDFNERTTQAVKETGFDLAFTSVLGINSAERFDPYRIKRIHVHHRRGVFVKDASGLGDVQRGVVRMLGL